MKHLILVLFILLSGCGASALQRSTMAADVSHSLLKGSYDVIAVVCAPERVRASESPAQRAEVCLQLQEGYEVAVAAWSTWVAGLLAVAEDDDAIEATRRLAGPVIRFLSEVGELLQAVGVDVPDVPEWLIAFVSEGGE